MSDAAQEPTVPPGYSAVTPWIISPDSAALVRFLEVAAEVAGSRMLNQDGSIAHIEVKIGSSIVMLFDSYEGWPETPAFSRLYLGDADAAYQRALEAGASPIARATELATASAACVTSSAKSGGCKATPPTCPSRSCRYECKTPAMLEAMRYVQQSLVDALRNQHNQQFAGGARLRRSGWRPARRTHG